MVGEPQFAHRWYRPLNNRQANVKNTNLFGIFSRITPSSLDSSVSKHYTSIPNSAVIKHVFSVKSDIIRLKRANLWSEDLEEIVFIKENEKREVSRLVLPE